MILKKRSQVTIFIIAALVILGLVAAYFLFGRGIITDIDVGSKPEENPKAFLNSYLEPHVEETLEVVSSQGGYINNKLHREIDGVKISYLCYNQNFYLACINQEPMLIEHLKEDIKNNIQPDVVAAFNELKNVLEEKGFEVEMQNLRFEVDLQPKKVILDIDRNFVVSKSGETSRYENFEIVMASRFYDLAVVVQEIVSQEARFCNFEQQGFMLFYPDFDIDKFRTGDSTTIYTVEHRKTHEQFKFAVRGCVIPPGF